ncbi:MAG: nitroreductase family protein [Flavobacteriaceae bacterium]
MENSLNQLIKKRRSIRIFKNTNISIEKVKKCIYNATLAPNSSNLQLWEFYHIKDKNKLKKISVACLNQNAAKTASQIVVVVVRGDLWKERAKENIKFLKNEFNKNHITEKNFKKGNIYYSKLIPFLYSDFLGLLSLFKNIIAQITGIFKPIYRQVKHTDKRIIAHKSAALAAQNFMLSMTSVGYDTCPMEGSDTLRVKQILKLPKKAEINMIIGCGIMDEKGVYGKRFRIPFEDVYNYI